MTTTIVSHFRYGRIKESTSLNSTVSDPLVKF
jgi:hypothetical protein